jgi:ABC-type branched-subunit amino acid transport system substrate-binding protein
MRFMSSRKVVALCVAGVAAFGVTGCGGDDAETEGGGGSSTTGTTATKGATGTPVKLMTITAVGSPLTNYPDIEAAAKAATKAINDAGGINGRPIEQLFCNTKGDVNGATKCAREAVKEKVAAAVGDLDIFASVAFPVLEKAKIPVIGQHPAGAENDFKSDYSWPLQGGNGASYSAFAYAAAKQGKKRFLVLTIDLPIAATQNAWAEAGAKDAGLEVLPQVKIPAQGVTDFTPFVQQAKSRNADAILIVQGNAGTQGVLKAAEAVGLDAMFGQSITSFGESEAEAVKGISSKVFVGSPYPSINDDSVPGIKKWQEGLDAAGIGDDPVLRRTAGLNTWLAYHAVAEVGKSIEGDITAESLVEALKSTDGPIDLDGLVSWEPSKSGTFGKLAHFPVHDFYVQTFKDGKIVDSGAGQIPDPLAPSR